MNVPNIYRLEMTDHSLENYNNVITEPLDIRDGFLHLNNKPGLGYELNHDFINLILIQNGKKYGKINFIL